ncbi:YutD family protein [Paenibacillus sp. YPG26]|uniref:YutD family protein n=1 Tax=Paenibacillus sp. YPG26 TaxID=2878915 RepID=UPI002041F338|nr:YutD family protein [Paenibacillus sp. YPG26]USB32572.1 YutD family protein [Paenibacillus sp. YPG26]
MIQVNGKSYEVIQENRNGWDPEAFKQRYSDVLERYDYIIGDWGYNQLRLKGFYRDNHPKVNKDSSISGIMDYINEYCNFGCPYFVLQRVKEAPREPQAAIQDPSEPREQSKDKPADGPEAKRTAPKSGQAQSRVKDQIEQPAQAQSQSQSQPQSVEPLPKSQTVVGESVQESESIGKNTPNNKTVPE